MENNVSRERLFGIGLRVLAVISFIAVLSIGMWGSVQVAKAVPNAFSSLAAAIASLSQVFIPASGETLTLSAPALTLASNETFTLSFEHTGKTTDGSYTFRYNCADGVHFVSPSGAESGETIFCNVPFHFLNSANAVALTLVSEKNRFIDVTLFIDFTPNGETVSSVQGSMDLTIVNENISGSPGTLPPSKPTTPAQGTPSAPAAPVKGPETVTTYPPQTVAIPPVSDPNGRVDLSARIIEVGLVNKTTGVFTASSTPSRVPQGERIAVRFAIENAGTKTSPQFAFNAVLPTYPSHIFSSSAQQVLNPGDRIEYTLAFDNFLDGNEGVFTVNVDPTGSVNEPNKTNNIVRYTVTVFR